MLPLNLGIEINVIDIEKALDFYCGELGFSKRRDKTTNEWIVAVNDHCFFRLKKSNDLSNHGDVIYIGVSDFDTVVSQLCASDKVINIDENHRSMTLVSPDNHKIVLMEYLLGEVLKEDFLELGGE